MHQKTIYIARHGQTEFNKRGIVQGSGVDSELNSTGLLQAERLFHAYQHIPFQKIITSNLKRTIQTAEHFINKFGNHKIYPEFNEINWGILEGVKPSPENRREFWETTQAWSKGNLTQVVGGGESPLEVQERMLIGKTKLINEMAENVFIVSHGRAMRIMMCTLLDIPLEKMDEFPHTNTSVYTLGYSHGNFQLLESNNVDHLSG